LGGHFKTPEDIVFSSIQVTYYGEQINKWINRFEIRGLFRSDKTENYIKYISRPSVKVKINERYNITILAKPRLLSSSEGEVREQSIEEVSCLEIESLKEKSLEEYFRVNRIILDFLNFIIPQEVYIKSIHGIRENRKDSKENMSSNQQEWKIEEVKIFYTSAITGMFKPDVRSQPIFPRSQSQRNSMPNLLENYLNKWFELSNTPLINLYCAVMFNPEMYMEYLFLGLAQAIESYQAKFIRTKSQEKMELEGEIRQMGRELSEEKAKRLEQMTKHCFDASLKERVAAVYHEYADVADSLFFFKGKEEFSKKVKDTRNYLTHWSEDGEKKAAHGDDLVFLTRDLQLLLQLCIMTQLGISKEDITKMHNVYYDGMRSLQEEDPEFFKKLKTGDTR
jgi:hypothetical protein